MHNLPSGGWVPEAVANRHVGATVPIWQGCITALWDTFSELPEHTGCTRVQCVYAQTKVYRIGLRLEESK